MTSRSLYRNPWLANRFTIVFGALALAILGWNLYVGAHAGGHLTGLVVDPSGRPVPDALVTLGRKTVVSVDSVRQTTTDRDGRFIFDRHGQYWIVLTATKAEAGTSERRMVPLWFRNQDTAVSPALVLERP